MVYLPLYRCCALSSLALSLLVLAPPAARADEAITPPKIDISRINDQPVYPDGARDKNERGNTVLSIYIDARGRSSNTTVETTSGYADLDKTAVASVWNLHFVPASQDGKDVAATIKVTVHFQLTPLPKPAVTESDVYALADAGDKIACRQPSPAVGSHIMPPRVCHTIKEWDAMAEQAKHHDSNYQHGVVQVPNH
jgi:TonB family protein